MRGKNLALVPKGKEEEDVPDEQKLSCWYSPSWEDVHINVGFVSEIGQGIFSYLLQTAGYLDDFLALILKWCGAKPLPTIPYLGYTLPTFIIAVVVMAYVTICSSISHKILNYITQKQKELLGRGEEVTIENLIKLIREECGDETFRDDAKFKIFIRKAATAHAAKHRFTFKINFPFSNRSSLLKESESSQEIVETSEGESTHLALQNEESKTQSEIEPLLAKPRKKNTFCGCCSLARLKPYQKVVAPGDMIAHTLDASLIVWTLWTAIKNVNNINSLELNAGMDLLAILIGIPSGVAYDKTCIKSWETYNKLMLIRESEKARLFQIAARPPEEDMTAELALAPRSN